MIDDILIEKEIIHKDEMGYKIFSLEIKNLHVT